MMLKTVLKGNLVLPDNILHQGYVVVEEEKISGIFAQKDMFQEEGGEFIDYGAAYIAPGFVDLHLHGAMGKDVMDAQEESVLTIVEHQASNGVTGFLGSTMSAPLDSVLDAIRMIKKAAKDPLPSEILGVYVEGPFVSTQKKGAHSASFLRGMTEKDCERLVDAVNGLTAVISLAPEVEENMRLIATLKAQGFVVAIGHTDATYDQALESFAKGVTHATHLYNAMSGFDHREPGVVGAVLDSDDVTAELIADGVHVHPSALRLAVARKGTKKICLVTDSMMASGVEQSDNPWKWGFSRKCFDLECSHKKHDRLDRCEHKSSHKHGHAKSGSCSGHGKGNREYPYRQACQSCCVGSGFTGCGYHPERKIYPEERKLK
jgi:N-acetylglucosamine-6-phosphate deacetylase